MKASLLPPLRVSSVSDERFLRISAYFEKHTKDFQIDDITWNDLDMDDLFKRMNYCLSSTGEEYLYYMLRTPEFEEEKLKHLNEVIEYYASNPKERVAFQILMKKLGTTGKFSLYDYIDYLHQLPMRSNVKEIFRILLVFVGIICMGVHLSTGILLVVAWMLFQIFDYYKKKFNNNNAHNSINLYSKYNWYATKSGIV